MGRVDRIFAELASQRRKAIMPFVVAGDPSLEGLGATLAAMERAGAAIVEVGIPFSDPIADGPVIAEAMHRALQRGVTPQGVMEQVTRARASLQIGLVAMVSVSIVERSGGPAFMRSLHAAGFDGVIVPDADLDAAMPLVAEADRLDMAFAMLVAPTTSDERLTRLVAASRGFVYLLARAGITGERTEAPEVADLVARVRHHTSMPLAVGFGISTASHVQAVWRHADAAIVGSSLVRRMAAGEDAGAVTRELLPA
ncbi:MAG: tryptophan synthase subunit alpha [Phycisphaerales bacterium]|jgi:tryptophan synthase alpha chain